MYIKVVLHPSQSRVASWRLKIFSAIKKLEVVDGQKHTWHLEVALLNLLKGVGLVGLVYYFAFAGFVKIWFDFKLPHNEITYVDVTNPMVWPQIPKKIGEAQIAEAFADLEQGNFRKGFLRLRSGIARNPEDTEARTALTVAYMNSGFIEESIKIMDAAWDGDKAVSLKYAEFHFGALELIGAHEHRVNLAETILAHTKSLSEMPEMELLAFVNALEATQQMGHFDATLHWSSRWRDAYGQAAFESTARLNALWELEEYIVGDDVIAKLEPSVANDPGVMAALMPFETREMSALDASIYAYTHEAWGMPGAWRLQLALICALAENGFVEESQKCMEFYSAKPHPADATIELFSELYLREHYENIALLWESLKDRSDSLASLATRVHLNSLMMSDEFARARQVYADYKGVLFLEEVNEEVVAWFDFLFSEDYPEVIPPEIESSLPNLNPSLLEISAASFAHYDAYELAIATMDVAISQRPFNEDFRMLSARYHKENNRLRALEQQEASWRTEELMAADSDMLEERAKEIAQSVASRMEAKNDTMLDGTSLNLGGQNERSEKAAVIAQQRIDRARLEFKGEDYIEDATVRDRQEASSFADQKARERIREINTDSSGLDSTEE